IRSHENAGDVVRSADLPDVINGVIVKLINGLRGLTDVAATRGLGADGPQRREHGASKAGAANDLNHCSLVWPADVDGLDHFHSRLRVGQVGDVWLLPEIAGLPALEVLLGEYLAGATARATNESKPLGWVVIGEGKRGGGVQERQIGSPSGLEV